MIKDIYMLSVETVLLALLLCPAPICSTDMNISYCNVEQTTHSPDEVHLHFFMLDIEATPHTGCGCYITTSSPHPTTVSILNDTFICINGRTCPWQALVAVDGCIIQQLCCDDRDIFGRNISEMETPMERGLTLRVLPTMHTPVEVLLDITVALKGESVGSVVSSQCGRNTRAPITEFCHDTSPTGGGLEAYPLARHPALIGSLVGLAVLFIIVVIVILVKEYVIKKRRSTRESIEVSSIRRNGKQENSKTAMANASYIPSEL